MTENGFHETEEFFSLEGKMKNDRKGFLLEKKMATVSRNIQNVQKMISPEKKKQNRIE